MTNDRMDQTEQLNRLMANKAPARDTVHNDYVKDKLLSYKSITGEKK